MPSQSYDGPVSRYLNRPLSRPLARALLPTPITANQVSVAALLIAGAVLAAFAAGWNVVAGLAIHISSLVDGVDGDLARARKSVSTFGGVLDSTLDRCADVLIIGGMTIWSVEHEDWSLAPVAGFVALAGALLVSYSRARIEASTTAAAGDFLFGLASRDVRLLIATVGAISGQLYWSLWILALISLLTVAWRLVALPRALS